MFPLALDILGLELVLDKLSRRYSLLSNDRPFGIIGFGMPLCKIPGLSQKIDTLFIIIAPSVFNKILPGQELVKQKWCILVIPFRAVLIE